MHAMTLIATLKQKKCSFVPINLCAFLSAPGRESFDVEPRVRARTHAHVFMNSK